ncbi:MAG: NADH-quinone oxidoreductase subunit NuoE [bacterium]|nr:NADH-quinone oxidoreductase subunit NuoE [bacterium]
MVRETAEDTSTDQGVDPAEIAAVLDELNVGPDSDLISILQNVQERLGWLPADALSGVSDRTGIPLSRVYGVVSFYAQFYTEPHGKHTIRCCRGTACHVRGGKRVFDVISHLLGVGEGETTPDMLFYLETVACIGTCFLAPAMLIDDQCYGELTPQRVESILKSYQVK